MNLLLNNLIRQVLSLFASKHFFAPSLKNSFRKTLNSSTNKFESKESLNMKWFETECWFSSYSGQTVLVNIWFGGYVPN